MASAGCKSRTKANTVAPFFRGTTRAERRAQVSFSIMLTILAVARLIGRPLTIKKLKPGAQHLKKIPVSVPELRRLCEIWRSRQDWGPSFKTTTRGCIQLYGGWDFECLG